MLFYQNIICYVLYVYPDSWRENPEQVGRLWNKELATRMLKFVSPGPSENPFHEPIPLYVSSDCIYFFNVSRRIDLLTAMQLWA